MALWVACPEHGPGWNIDSHQVAGETNLHWSRV